MRKRLWNRFQNLGIAKKLLVLSLIVSIGPICCILIINYQLSARVMQKQTGELLEANLEQSAANIENLCKNMEKIVQGVYTDEFYTEKLKPINQWNLGERYQASYEIENRLRDICSNNQGILGAAILGMHYDISFYDSVTQSGQTAFCFDLEKMRGEKILECIRKNRGTIYSPSIQVSQGEFGTYNCIYIVHQLTDFSEYQKGPVGCVVLCVDEEALEQIYCSGNTESNMTLIADKNGNLISASIENWKPVRIMEDDKKRKSEEIEKAALAYVNEKQLLRGKNLQVRSVEILDGQFLVLNIQDFDYAARDFRYITVIIVLVGILTAVLSLILVFSTSESVEHSVKPILEAMDKAEQREGEWIEEEKLQGDEFVKISRHFNKMLKNMKESRNMERQALIREKNAEIKALEAQINPHFLYNTLDAINWLAVDNEEYAISKMLTGLASILRYSIHKSNEIVELENELVYLKKYVQLQQQRMNYSFICSMEVDTELYHVKIHKMLIQPLLENTLVHGFPGRTDMDEIKISIQKEGSGILITVEDNGIGMAPDMADMFNHYNYAKDRIESSIGIRNVIARLKLYYGDAGKLKIESDKNGTKIRMIIPVTEKEETE